MANNAIEILIKARDEATAQLRAAAVAASGLTGSLHGLAAAAGPIGAVAAAMLGVASAAFVAARSLADEVEQLQNLSFQTGVTIQDLQILQQLLKEAGGTAGDATQAINFLNRAIATQDPLLAKLGITTKDTWTAFNQLVQILASSSNAADNAEVSARLLGRGFTQLLGKVPALAAALGDQGLRGEMDRLNVAMSDDAIKAAGDLDKKLDELDRRLKGLSNSFKLAALAALNAANYWRPQTADEKIKETENRVADLRKRLEQLREAASSPIPAVQIAFKSAGGAEEIAKLKEQIALLDLALHNLRPPKIVPDSSAGGATSEALRKEREEAAAKKAAEASQALAKALRDVRDAADTPALAALAEDFLKADAAQGKLLQSTKEYLALAVKQDITDTARALAAQDAAAASAADSMGRLARSAADIPQIELTLGEVPEITVPPVPPVVLSVAAPNVPAITVPPVPPISLSIAPVDVPAIEVPPVPPIALTFGPVPAVTVPPIVAPPIELSVGEVPAVELPPIVPPPIVFTVAPVEVPEIAAPVVPPIALTVAPVPPIVVPPVASPVITPTVTPIPPIEVPAPVVPDIVLKVAPIPPVDFPAVNVPPVVVSVAPIPAPVVPPVETPEIVYKVQPIPAPEFPAIEVPTITVPPIKLSVDAAGIGDLASQAAAAASQVDALAAAVDRVQPVSLTIPPIDLSSGVADLAKLSQGLTESAAAAEELRRQTAAPVVVSADASGLEAAGKAAQALRAEAGRRVAVSVDGAPLASLREQYEAVGAALKAAALGIAGFGGLFLKATSATDAHGSSIAKLEADYRKFLGVAAPLRELLKTVAATDNNAVDEFGKAIQPKEINRKQEIKEVPFDFEKAHAAQAELIRQGDTLRGALLTVGAAWKETVAEMLETTSIANEAFGALFNGLQSGFSQVASGLLQQGQTFKSAFVTIFRSLVNEVVQMLARLAALKLFQFVVGAAFGGAGGFALPLVGGAGAGGIGLNPVTGNAGGGASSFAQAQAQAQTNALLERQNQLLERTLNAPAGDTVYLSGLNTRDLYESYVAPGGELRRAQDRLIEVAAVS